MAFSPTLANLRTWSSVGLAFAAVQAATITTQYAATRSPTVLVCMIVCMLFTLAYLGYVRRTRRADSGSGQLQTRDKYFLVLHLLFATWYFWIALITFELHNVDVFVWDVLSPSSTSSVAFTTGARGLAAGLFATTVVSIAVDAYAIRSHTVTLARVDSVSVEESRSRKDRPSAAAALTVALDLVAIALTAAVYARVRDHGLIALLLLLIFSVISQGVYAWQAFTRPYADADWHVISQLILMQHVLIISTAFLVNLLVLLLSAVGLSVAAIVKDGTTAESAQALVSILAYFFMGVTTIVLVNMHSQMDADGAPEGSFRLQETGGAGDAYRVPSIVPVALPGSGGAGYNANPAFGHGPVPVPVAPVPVPVYSAAAYPVPVPVPHRPGHEHAGGTV